LKNNIGYLICIWNILEARIKVITIIKWFSDPVGYHFYSPNVSKSKVAQLELQSWGNKANEEQKRTVYSTKRTN
jgi:hypothetical protein